MQAVLLVGGRSVKQINISMKDALIQGEKSVRYLGSIWIGILRRLEADTAHTVEGANKTLRPGVV